ncbi:hypothetical protein IMZ48_05975 [Candidatus Bathyarchaeota archaeon]|nr:hypothetical protein [Candidatus Bathyarchaeota archaeon]
MDAASPLHPKPSEASMRELDPTPMADLPTAGMDKDKPLPRAPRDADVDAEKRSGPADEAKPYRGTTGPISFRTSRQTPKPPPRKPRERDPS